MNLTPTKLYELFGNEYIRLTNEKETHNEFKYTTGFNVDHIPFNPSGECKAGGLYFFSVDQLKNFPKYTNDIVFMRKVTFPPDSRIYAEGKYENGIFRPNKFKADKFILEERENFFLPEDQCLDAVRNNGLALKYVKNQTYELCMVAVKQNGRAMKYVNEQTIELCMEAVNQDGLAIKFIKEQTTEMCMIAISQYGMMIKYIKNPTKEMYEKAAKSNANVLYIKNKFL